MSPAPAVSNTSAGRRERCRTGSPRTASDMPLAARVTRIAPASQPARAAASAASISASVSVGRSVARPSSAAFGLTMSTAAVAAEAPGLGVDDQDGVARRRRVPAGRDDRGSDHPLAVVRQQDRAAARGGVLDRPDDPRFDFAGDRVGRLGVQAQELLAAGGEPRLHRRGPLRVGDQIALDIGLEADEAQRFGGRAVAADHARSGPRPRRRRRRCARRCRRRPA